MKTLIEVKDICKKIMVSQGYDIDLPISINNRFKNTFGRVTINHLSNKVEKVEFAAVLLDSNNDAEIMDTIKHELAHVLAFLFDGQNHGHDSTWKNIFLSLGGSGDVHFSQKEFFGEDVDKAYKYTAYCSKCGKFIQGFARAGKVVKQPQLYKTKCCRAIVKIKQNW